MREIKNILEEKLQNFELFPRRFGIREGKINLFGPPKSGKTSLALLITKSYKYSIYIDCKDPRNDIEILTSQILKAFLEKKIELLILDNYQNDFTLPNIHNIILITSKPLNPLPKDFSHKAILPLNFTEFISISSTANSLTHLLNDFLKYGNSPENYHLYDFQKILKSQENLQYFFQENYPFFLQLVNFQSQKVTINHLYTHIKRFIKVSKNKTYYLIDTLEKQRFIFLIKHKDPKIKVKKLYFYNFAIPYAFCKTPNFQAIFENMVLLEILHQYKIPIFYAEECHFIVEDKNFFALPFPNNEEINKIIQKNPNKKNIIIALNAQKNTSCKIVDFISFALGDFD